MVKWVGGAGLLLVLSVTNVPPVVAAEPGKKEAWEYTLDERLEMRFGPDTGAPVRRREDGPPEPDAEKGKVVSVEGASNPELLVPFELFQRLLGRAYGPHEISRQIYRDQLNPLLQSLGFENEFWKDLELMADDLLKVDRERRRRTQNFAALSERDREEASRGIVELQATYCQDRARILEVAESTFGKERFHKFLYQGVAPSGLTTTSGWTPEQMRFIAGGCQ
jgi:hypothetical protein